MKKIAIVLLVVLFPSTAFAGAWTQPEGAAYGKVSAGLTMGNGLFANDGEIITDNVDDFLLASLGAYSELGLTKEVTAMFNGQIVGFGSYGDETATTAGPYMFGLRYGLPTGKIPVSLEGRLGFDTGLGSDNLADGTPFRYAPGRDIGWTGEFLASAGWGVGSFWMNGGVGVRGYTTGQSPDLMANLDLGYSFSDFDLSISFPFNYALELDDVANYTGVGTTRYFGIGLNAGYWLTDHVGLSVSAAGVAFANANLAAPALSLGVQFRGNLF